MTYFNYTNQLINYLTIGTPIIISFSVALISFFQYKINNEKLRLDLYNRRFSVYEKTLKYFLQYFENNSSRDSYLEIKNDFVHSYRESLFLFGRESEVYQILTNIKDTIGFLYQFNEKFNSDFYDKDEYKYWSKEKESKQDPTFLMDSLEKSLEKWLNFHNI
jgi:hypothetical protein